MKKQKLGDNRGNANLLISRMRTAFWATLTSKVPTENCAVCVYCAMGGGKGRISGKQYGGQVRQFRECAQLRDSAQMRKHL